ncbi:hypothetical protein C791_8616 [Amycolatopsis azurea DSM 43854]|uniref:Uncharacterized protein n=1 Tax=Amycolatopsis azurea DSM 43854 TaxID=1238180 RepID=M2NJH6_9PSEU|nr:hypothetical protein C791_8616 [Amycolatopsis azurea DSM 43854]
MPALFGDDLRERVLAARPQCPGVGAQRRGGDHQVRDTARQRIGIRVERAASREEVPQRPQDRNALGPGADRGGQSRLAFVPVAENERLLATREVREQRGHRRVRGVRDLRDGDVVEAPLQEQLPRRPRQGLTGRRLLTFAPALLHASHLTSKSIRNRSRCIFEVTSTLRGTT